MKIMKTTKVLLHIDKINREETPKRRWRDKVLQYILLVFMLSSMSVLSSCAVGYETPDYAVGIEVPEYDSFGVIIDPWDYHWRHEHHEWIHQHPNWRHEYQRHDRDYQGHDRDRH